MYDVLTHGERSLARTDHSEAIHDMRRLFQETMEPDMCAAVERLTGHHVVALISGNHIDPDISAELFILDAPL
jgi:uncharacterized protein YbcI